MISKLSSILYTILCIDKLKQIYSSICCPSRLNINRISVEYSSRISDRFHSNEISRMPSVQ